jgi:hypothetical protein
MPTALTVFSGKLGRTCRGRNQPAQHSLGTLAAGFLAVTAWPFVTWLYVVGPAYVNRRAMAVREKSTIFAGDSGYSKSP